MKCLGDKTNPFFSPTNLKANNLLPRTGTRIFITMFTLSVNVYLFIADSLHGNHIFELWI